MKIVIAEDSYKGCLSAPEVCRAIAQGIRLSRNDVECIELPLSDGGDGMMELFNNDRYIVESINVCGPFYNSQVPAKIAFTTDGTTAIIESAQACGLSLLTNDELNPMETTTAGVGEMLQHAVKRGCRRIIIGLGGTASNDLGTGMLAMIGVKFIDEEGVAFLPNGGNIGRIRQLANLSCLHQFNGIDILIASDVNNPLYGINGAARVFAPQKGADQDMVTKLEQSALFFKEIVKQHLNIDRSLEPGAGAAGGLGFTLMSFLNCDFRSGASLLLDELKYQDAFIDADLIITGEGRSDRQTLMGKAPYIVLERAKQLNVPTALVSGAVECPPALVNAGFVSIIPATPQSQDLNEALKKNVAINNLKRAASRLITQISL